jgi:hypothetical protein
MRDSMPLIKKNFNYFIQGQVWSTKNKDYEDIVVCDIVNFKNESIIYCYLGLYKGMGVYAPIISYILKSAVDECKGLIDYDEFSEYEKGYDVWLKTERFPHFTENFDIIVKKLHQVIDSYIDGNRNNITKLK